MNGEYLWACMCVTLWTPCIVLGETTYYDRWAYIPHKCDGYVDGYRIIFWDSVMEDFVERNVPKGDVRFV